MSKPEGARFLLPESPFGVTDRRELAAILCQRLPRLRIIDPDPKQKTPCFQWVGCY